MRPDVDDSSPAVRRVRSLHLLRAVALLAVISALAWSRCGNLTQSLWNDEAFSAVTFVRSGPAQILTRYIPNNHVLFNLLAWVTIRLFGESEIAYRFWGVAPGCAALLLIVGWLWSRGEATAAIVFVALATMNLLLLELGREARGYGLALLAQAALLIVGDRLLVAQRTSRLLLYALAGVAGTLTLPVFVLSLASGAFVIAALDRTQRRRVATMMIASSCILAIAYSGVAGQVVRSSAQEFGERLAWHDVASAPIRHLVLRSGTTLFAPEASEDAVAATIGVLVVLGVARLCRLGAPKLATLLVVPVLLAYGALAALSFYVEARFLSFLAINVTVLLALGIVEVLSVATRSRVATIGITSILFVVCCQPLERFFDVVRSTHSLPRENFRDAAAIARATGFARVVTNSARPVGLFYYLPGTIRTARPGQLVSEFCTSDDGLVFIDHPFAAPSVDLRCLVERGAVQVRVLQRERDEHIDVWTLYPQCSTLPYAPMSQLEASGVGNPH